MIENSSRLKDLPPARVAPVRISSTHLKRNAILSGLAGGKADVVLAQATLVVLPVRFQIYWPNEPIREVYIPLDCVLPIVTRMRDGSQIEIGTVGCEGVSAIPLLLGASSTANESYCQVAGAAIKMSATGSFRPVVRQYARPARRM